MKCTTFDCVNIGVYKSGVCNSCYYRVKRTGTLGRRPRVKKRRTSAGYVKVWAKGHPLADKSHCAFEHRVIVYDTHGPGPHPCYWCAKPLEWEEIHVDHLNDVKDDNETTNLVIACAGCNQARGMAIAMARRLSPAAFSVFLSSIQAARVNGSTF